jgi:hypothetical protein
VRQPTPPGSCSARRTTRPLGETGRSAATNRVTRPPDFSVASFAVKGIEEQARIVRRPGRSSLHDSARIAGYAGADSACSCRFPVVAASVEKLFNARMPGCVSTEKTSRFATPARSTPRKARSCLPWRMPRGLLPDYPTTEIAEPADIAWTARHPADRRRPAPKIQSEKPIGFPQGCE